MEEFNAILKRQNVVVQVPDGNIAAYEKQRYIFGKLSCDAETNV